MLQRGHSISDFGSRKTAGGAALASLSLLLGEVEDGGGHPAGRSAYSDLCPGSDVGTRSCPKVSVLDFSDLKRGGR
jgi:hypothetical protein